MRLKIYFTLLCLLSITTVFGQVKTDEIKTYTFKEAGDRHISLWQPSVENRVLTKTVNPKRLSRNMVYIELLGLSHLESINFERLLFSFGSLHFSGRAGLGFMEYLISPPPGETEEENGLDCGIAAPVWIPVSFSAMLGNRNSFLESSVGMTFSTQPDYNLFPSAGLGYRYQAAPQGLFLRISSYAMYTSVNSKISVRPGFSLGYCFD